MQIQTPDWVKHAVFYQIFPDRFAQAKTPRKQLLKSPGWETWDLAPSLQGYKGGNLWGVIEELDYLQDLGINAIYFTPIFQSASNHRYHTHDYYQVDPVLGGNPALKELLDAAHQRNIKVVLDGVFNHASRGFFFFHDILENGVASPWLDWFKIEDFPLSAYDESKPANYVGWAGLRALPQFNHDNSEVREYLMEIAEYWIDFGIDGWRLDVPFEVKTPGFWQEFRERVKHRNPEAYIVGEVWHDARQWLDGTQFDGVMNYLFTGPTIAFTAGDRVRMELVQSPSYFPYPPIFAHEYAEKIQALLNLYPWDIQLTQLNLLDSHDTARMISVANGDKASVELATILLLTYPGAPSIYYGDEVGLPGELDPDCRRGFPLIQHWEQDVLDYHRRLIAIRHRYKALRIGSYEILYAEGMVYSFVRSLGTEEVITVVNCGTESAHVRIPSTHLNSYPDQVVYGNCQPSWIEVGDSRELELYLTPRSGCIITNQ